VCVSHGICECFLPTVHSLLWSKHEPTFALRLRMKPIGPFLIHLRNQGVLETIRTGAILAIVSVTHYGGDEAEAISSAVKFR
jgi:hypothetical protein